MGRVHRVQAEPRGPGGRLPRGGLGPPRLTERAPLRPAVRLLHGSRHLRHGPPSRSGPQQSPIREAPEPPPAPASALASYNGTATQVVRRLERCNFQEAPSACRCPDGGGDCPGLNTAIRAVVRRGVRTPRLGVHRVAGWLGGPAGGQTMELGLRAVSRHPAPGGTVLGSWRAGALPARKHTSRSRSTSSEQRRRAGHDRGRGHPRGGHRALGAGPAPGRLPKTIDNDLSGTDPTFGFDTAIRSSPTRSTGCTPPPVPPPRDRRRGDGAARGLDNARRGHRRRGDEC